MARLTADSVTLRHGPRPLLSDVYLEVESGEVVGLVGRNGSGKTTLLRWLAGIEAAASGVVTVDGGFVPRRDRWRLIAYLPQESYLPRDMEVRRASRLFAGTPADSMLDSDPRLRSLLHRKVRSLSPGERRYLELCLVLALGRPFVLLDEPFTQIEPLYVELLTRALLGRRQGVGYLITDHDYRSVRGVCSRLLSLESGELRAIGTSDDELRKAGYLPLR